jgi:hypothetical protein
MKKISLLIILIIVADKWNAVEEWSNLLERLCSFTVDTDCIDIDPDFTSHKLGMELDVLYNSLPIGLIASGFLANCVLTEHLDHKLDDYCTQKKNEGKPTYVTRYTDDIMIVIIQLRLKESTGNPTHIMFPNSMPHLRK